MGNVARQERKGRKGRKKGQKEGRERRTEEGREKYVHFRSNCISLPALMHLSPSENQAWASLNIEHSRGSLDSSFLGLNHKAGLWFPSASVYSPVQPLVLTTHSGEPLHCDQLSPEEALAKNP